VRFLAFSLTKLERFEEKDKLRERKMLKSLHNKIRMPIFAVSLKSEMVLQRAGRRHHTGVLV
jgi:hypothetical protein